MSKHDKIAKLKEYIKNLVVQELKDDELEEVSTTATAGIDGTGTGHYDTPRAFASGSAVGHKNPEVGGYKKIKESVITERIEPRQFNKDFDMAINLVIKQANNLKGSLAKHPIKRNVNKLKAVQKLFKKFVAPALVKANRDIGMSFDFTNIRKRLTNGQFKSVLKYDIMSRIGGNSYDSNSFYGLDDKEKKLLDRIYSEFRKLTNLMDDAQLESVNEASTLTLRGKNGKMVDVPRKFASIISGIDRGMSKFNPRGVMFGHRKYHKLKPNDEYSGSIVLKNPLSKKDIDDVMKQLKRIGSSLGFKFEKITFNPDRNEPFIEFRVKPEQFNESVNEGRYHDWRNDESMTPKQKVGRSMREIRDALNELDKTVKMNLKLKTELNMNSKDYWKNTHKALTKISERLVKMANKIGNLK